MVVFSGAKAKSILLNPRQTAVRHHALLAYSLRLTLFLFGRQFTDRFNSNRWLLNALRSPSAHRLADQHQSAAWNSASDLPSRAKQNVAEWASANTYIYSQVINCNPDALTHLQDSHPSPTVTDVDYLTGLNKMSHLRLLYFNTYYYNTQSKDFFKK